MKNWIVALGLLLLALTTSPATRIHKAQAAGLHATTTLVAENGGDDDNSDDEDGEEDFC